MGEFTRRDFGLKQEYVKVLQNSKSCCCSWVGYCGREQVCTKQLFEVRNFVLASAKIESNKVYDVGIDDYKVITEGGEGTK
jgi:hypothetical protein